MDTFKTFNFSLLALILFSCDSSPLEVGVFERVDVYSVKESAAGMEKDTLQYAEIAHYNTDRVLLKKYYYDSKNVLKGKEIISDDQFSKTHYRGEYFDADGNLLSYYKHVKNKFGEKMSSAAFDASNDEFIRIERFRHVDGQRTVKEIRDNDDNIKRRMEFAFDKNGNEIAVAVSDENGNDILLEQYKIIKQDQDGQWLEKWGFVDGVPFSFRERSYGNSLKELSK